MSPGDSAGSICTVRPTVSFRISSRLSSSEAPVRSDHWNQAFCGTSLFRPSLCAVRKSMSFA